MYQTANAMIKICGRGIEFLLTTTTRGALAVAWNPVFTVGARIMDKKVCLSMCVVRTSFRRTAETYTSVRVFTNISTMRFFRMDRSKMMKITRLL